METLIQASYEGLALSWYRLILHQFDYVLDYHLNRALFLIESE